MPVPLEAGGAGFCKLFVLLINEPDDVCVCVCVIVYWARWEAGNRGEVKRNNVVGGRRRPLLINTTVLVLFFLNVSVLFSFVTFPLYYSLFPLKTEITVSKYQRSVLAFKMIKYTFINLFFQLTNGSATW